MNIKRESFELLKVKLTDGAVEISRTLTYSDGAGVVNATGKETVTTEPHPDLRESINALTDYVHRVFPFEKEHRDKIKVNGCSISGIGESRGVIITAVYQTPSGRKVALNSDRIPFSGTAYGWEEDLEPIVNRITNEVYAYVVEGKQAQLEIAFPEPETLFNAEA